MLNGLTFQISRLLAVAFFTLLERKILRYIQTRKGPNKVVILGVLQPLTDAVKLLIKEQIIPVKRNKVVFYIAPGLSLALILLRWLCVPIIDYILISQLSFIFFLFFTGLNVYSLIIAGWSSNSVYATLGIIRGLAQAISYEVCYAFILILPILMLQCLSFFRDKPIWVVLISPFILLLWIISCLAETNRAPFDFAEGESELVSGFNIEYGSGLFALLFLSEYGNILLLRVLTSFLFLPFARVSFFFCRMVGLIVSILFLWARATLPRFRYDLLIVFCWLIILPSILAICIFRVWI